MKVTDKTIPIGERAAVLINDLTRYKENLDEQLKTSGAEWKKVRRARERANRTITELFKLL